MNNDNCTCQGIADHLSQVLLLISISNCSNNILLVIRKRQLLINKSSIVYFVTLPSSWERKGLGLDRTMAF